MAEFKNEPFTPIQFANPVEQYQNVLKTQYLASEIAKAQREEDDSTGTANAYKNALLQAKNPDGSLDEGKLRAGVRTGLITNGQGHLVSKYDKANADTDQAVAKGKLDMAQGGKADIEAQLKTMEYFHDRYKSIDPTSSDAPMQAYQIFKEEAANPLLAKLAAANGVSPDQHIQQRVAEMQPNAQNPQSLSDWFTRQSMDAKSAAAALEKKKLVVNGGDHNDVYTWGKDGRMVKDLTTPRAMADHSVRVTVNANQYAADELAKTLGKETGKTYTGLEAIANNATSTINELDNIIDKVSRGKVYTGMAGKLQLAADKATVAAGGKLTPEHQEMMNNTEEVNKYLANNLVQRIAALNKAGLGARNSVHLTKLEQEANANGTMEPLAILKVLMNQRKSVQDSVPKLNQMRQALANSPNQDVRNVMQTLVKQPLEEIPDHPLYAPLVGAPGAPAEPARAYPVPNSAVVNALKSGRINKAAFDSQFGPGSADKALRGK